MSRRDWTAMLLAGVVTLIGGAAVLAGLGLFLAGLAVVAETALRAMLEVMT